MRAHTSATTLHSSVFRTSIKGHDASRTPFYNHSCWQQAIAAAPPRLYITEYTCDATTHVATGTACLAWQDALLEEPSQQSA